jgi:hypothetical protein
MANKIPITIYPASSCPIEQIQAGDFVDPAALGSGTPNSTTFLRGDQTWAVPAGGSATIDTFQYHLYGAF